MCDWEWKLNCEYKKRFLAFTFVYKKVEISLILLRCSLRTNLSLSGTHAYIFWRFILVDSLLYYMHVYLLLFLQLLDLSRNRLNGFDDIFVWKLRQIKDVKLESNPLICDRCHMGVLIDIAQTVRYTTHTHTQNDMVIFLCWLAKRKKKRTNERQYWENTNDREL